MPRPHPFVFFALGAAVGAFGWLTLAPLPRSASSGASPAPAGPDSLAAAHAASSETHSQGNTTTIGSAATAEPALHLWEALALRGAPKDNETRWFKLPDMTGLEGYGSATADAPINPAFAAFFNLTPEESDRAQALLQSTLRLQHEMDVARIERIESKFRIKTAIGIPDYSTESALLRQTFDGGLRAILGDTRHRVYQDWAAKPFRDDFPGLAGVRREYHIIPARADDPPGSVQVVTVKLAPGKAWTGGGSFTTGFTTIAEAESATQLPLARYLPAPTAP